MYLKQFSHKNYQNVFFSFPHHTHMQRQAKIHPSIIESERKGIFRFPGFASNFRFLFPSVHFCFGILAGSPSV